MSRFYISIQQRQPGREGHDSTLVLDPAADRVSTLGVIPHCSQWRPETAADRDALVEYLQAMEYPADEHSEGIRPK